MTERAAVLRAAGELEVVDFATPTIAADQALLDVEACGICGSDFETFAGPLVVPVVLGHEVVGRIREIGADAARLWRRSVGDRVVVNEVLPCGRCELCSGGHQELCNGFFGTNGARVGHITTDIGGGLWGGFATTMLLDPRTQSVAIADSVPTEIASMFMPVANGVHWLVELGDLRPGASVLVVGPGPQGLAVTAVACLQPGVRVLVVGRDADAERLDIARKLGALTVSSESDDVAAAVRDALGSDGADLVVVATAGASTVLASATRWVRVGGRIVVAGTNGWTSETGFKSDALVFRSLALIGAPGHSWKSVRAAVRLLEAQPAHFAPLVGPTIGLDEVADVLARRVALGAGAHVTVDPNR